MSEKLKVNDRVVILERCSTHGNQHMVEGITHKVVANVKSVNIHNGKDYANIQFISKGALLRSTNSLLPCLRKATPEEIEAYEKFKKKECTTADEADEKRAKGYIKPRKYFLEREVYKENNSGLGTHLSFVQRGRLNDRVFNPSDANFLADCCALTQTTNDLQVFIPDFWLKVNGYNKTDLTRWLNFLKDSDIGFDYIYEGSCKLDKRFEQGRDFSKTWYNTSTYLFKQNGDFHKIIIPAGKGNFQTYFKFILIRYIWSSYYWKIPALAMQIKEALGDKVNNIQAVLFAQLGENFSNGHGLVSNNDQTYANPLQDTKSVFEGFSTHHNMNGSWNYVQYTSEISRAKVQSLVRGKKYEELYNLLKK